MSIIAIIVAMLGGLCLLASVATGYLLLLCVKYHRFRELGAFWLTITCSFGVAGGLLAWAAAS